jgi:hypothetical protein
MSPMIEFVFAAAKSMEEPLDVSLTIGIAAGSALLGAVAGGMASFQASVALDGRRRKARAAIRRKAKVYTPIRAELRALRTETTKAIVWGIDRQESDPDPPVRGPKWRLWLVLKADGRATTAASVDVSKCLDHLEMAIDDFENGRKQALKCFSAVGYRVYKEVTGRDMKLMNAWDSGGDLLDALEDKEEVWSPLGIVDRSQPTDYFPEFREKFNGSPGVTEMRTLIYRVLDELETAIDQAIAELDKSMASIARKYEREEVRD